MHQKNKNICGRVCVWMATSKSTTVSKSRAGLAPPSMVLGNCLSAATGLVVATYPGLSSSSWVEKKKKFFRLPQKHYGGKLVTSSFASKKTHRFYSKPPDGTPHKLIKCLKHKRCSRL